MSPAYEVFGAADGSGLVIFSDDPVGFHPSAKTVNVVRVADRLHDALRHVNVATQTVGIFPPSRAVSSCAIRWPRTECNASCRWVRCINVAPGYPHDGFFALHRFVKWLVDEC